MIQHLGFQLGAEDAMTIMLEDNKELLVNRVNAERVSNFVELVRRHGKTTEVVPKFLEACCDSNGEAIVENQNMLVEEVLDKEDVRRDMLLEVKLSDERDNLWAACCPNSAMARDMAVSPEFQGSEVLHEKVGKVLVTWTTPPERAEESVQRLFHDMWDLPVDGAGRVWVPLEEVYRRARLVSKKWKTPGRSAKGKGGGSSRDAKRAAAVLKSIGKYFRRQVLLLAQMCIGRNYMCMKAIEREYPYLLCYTARRDSQRTFLD